MPAPRPPWWRGSVPPTSRICSATSSEGHLASRRGSGLATQLIRSVSPTVRVHDLGLTSYEIGERRIALAETRRKSAALLLFLVTRSDLAANREQAMEALWPDQTPKSALNSLHQTIFFLRRELEPWYEDGDSADYVHMDTELVRLDRSCSKLTAWLLLARQPTSSAAGRRRTRGPEMLALYSGQFAPEFEYEEWAAEWRTHLHTTYLHLAHATSSALLRERRFGEVVEVLTPVVGQWTQRRSNPRHVGCCLAAAGARDASLAQYRSLAVAHERDLGLPARPSEELVQAVSAMPLTRPYVLVLIGSRLPRT